MNIINFPLCIASSRIYSFNPGLYLATILSRATPGLSEWSPKPGYSRTLRQLSDAGPLPDRSATIRSRACPGLFGHYAVSGFSRTIQMIPEAGRAAPGLSSYSLKSRFPFLPRLRKAFLRRQESIFMTIIIITYRKPSPLCTHTPDNNTYDTQWTRFINISLLTDVAPGWLWNNTSWRFLT